MIRRLLSILFILWTLGLTVFTFTLPGPLAGVRTDGAIALTGGRGRVARGLEVVADKQAKRLLISGVDRPVQPYELALAYGYPRSLFDCCVDLDRDSFDTRTNAEESAKWIKRRGYGSIRLITSDWHMRRATLELRRLIGDKVTIHADAIRTTPDMAGLLIEYNKTLWRLLSLPFDRP
ncbi:YdcF family protein [Aquisediminimonas sediminicola]|uniref:YdcF family protein n=1 Tax=Alteraquisediminimonas sediminicola TaxID=2676787 RepID=UPI001C8E8E2E|nr:YdcF family protein [Aquisediminimonas sediminicola]